MKWKVLPILFALVYAVTILLTLSLVFSVETLNSSTPFVKDILFFTFPLIGGSLSSYAFYSSLLFTLAPTSVIGCLIACMKSPPRTLVNAFYTFQLVIGIVLLFMQDQSDKRFDLEVELIESIMQYDRTNNLQDAKKWDVTHRKLKCCGYDDYQDWFVTPNEMRTDVPDSCCLLPIKRCGVDASRKGRIEEKIHTRGCYPLICDRLRNIRFIYLSVVFLILAIPSVVFARRIRSWVLAIRRQRD
ncbi:tetraspanin-9-like [Daphnia pulex]|uniref:tetraspanin-9-like n=1 Tax=Daphnia pulex TaxID=6669 RepID=UPI001EDD35DC|nr:tetraspanin-9-like [Daphnia pulex]